MFGRTIDQYWLDYTSGIVDVARVKYGYDLAGNRTWREDAVAAANNEDHDEFYTYDGLDRLVTFDRGNLTGTPPSGIAGTPAREEDWTLDQLGNWWALVQKTGGTTVLDQDRQHNDVNEIDGDNTHDNPPAFAIYGGPDWADPVHDAAGNMTTMPQPLAPSASYLATYDAWNRLVEVKDGANVVQENEYDGLGRRIVRSVYDSGTLDYRIHYYYNGQWQLLEERKEESGTEVEYPLAQYVWHPYYIDALALRYWDGNVDGDYEDTNEGAHYYLQDANYNVTAVVDDSGAVLERYSYTPYGEVTVLDADFSEDTDGWSDIGNEHLYTGRERDEETGLQLNRHRYYAPHLGRWLTRDPIGYYGSPWNLYEYVESNGVAAMDSMGLINGPYSGDGLGGHGSHGGWGGYYGGGADWGDPGDYDLGGHGSHGGCFYGPPPPPLLPDCLRRAIKECFPLVFLARVAACTPCATCAYAGPGAGVCFRTCLEICGISGASAHLACLIGKTKEYCF